LVATADTTDTVDPLPQLAELARREGACFHVDAACGGFFRLTKRGSERFVDMEDADSIILDPHKTLFMSFGTGVLVVRDPTSPRAAHDGTGSYL
jgi:aromatic-L-amino-acid decarboxylase